MTAEGLQNLVEGFARFGVSKVQIEKRIQRRIDAIQPAQVISLRNIWKSIRDGMSAPDEWFEPEATAQPEKKGASGLKDKLRKKESQPMIPAEPSPSEDPSTSETTQTKDNTEGQLDTDELLNPSEQVDASWLADFDRASEEL